MSLIEDIKKYCYNVLPSGYATGVAEYIRDQFITNPQSQTAIVEYMRHATPDQLMLAFNYKVFSHKGTVTPQQLSTINALVQERYGSNAQLQELCITVGSLLCTIAIEQVTTMVTQWQIVDIIHNNTLMAPHLWKVERMDDAQRGKQLTRLSIYSCPNQYCGSTNVVWSEAQTRSADEPATIFISCRVCGQNSSIQG